jgi:hypothetical protein
MAPHEGNPKQTDDCCDSCEAAPVVAGTTTNVMRTPERECSSMKSSAKAGELVFAPSGLTPEQLARSSLRRGWALLLLFSQPADGSFPATLFLSEVITAPVVRLYVNDARKERNDSGSKRDESFWFFQAERTLLGQDASSTVAEVPWKPQTFGLRL